MGSHKTDRITPWQTGEGPGFPASPPANLLTFPLPHLLLLTAILLAGFALRTAYLTVDRFHADEALYAGWALLIQDGDPFLTDVPVDKPPLFLYLLAGSSSLFGRGEIAFRLPNLAASMAGIALVYRLARRLYGARTGMWAAALVAFSPFDILFARTAFTDPVLMLWTLAALCAAAGRHGLWTGAFLGLAFATKQHALLLVPLALAVGILQSRRTGETDRALGRRSRWPILAAPSLGAVVGFAVPFALTIAWDSARWPMQPGYWQQSALSYGGLAWAPPAEWGKRFLEWLGWGRYLVPSLVQSGLWLLGGIALLVWGWRHRPRDRRTWLDTLFVAYPWGYLLLHAVLRFSIWDRYLLPLVVPVSLIVARVVDVFWEAHKQRSLSRIQGQPARRWEHLAAAALLLLILFVPARKAARNDYPVGGEHWAYQGLDQVVAYLQANAPPDAVLYHHWLRWHYTYYLYGSTFELRWWESGEHLRREATRTPERAQYIVLPDWRTLEPDAEGIRLRPVYEAHRQDGSVSMRVYRIEIQDP